MPPAAGRLPPFVILSNGRDHWFWNLSAHHQDAFRIERLPSLSDLERLRLKNMQPARPLSSEFITPQYLMLPRYQIAAMNKSLPASTTREGCGNFFLRWPRAKARHGCVLSFQI